MRPLKTGFYLYMIWRCNTGRRPCLLKEKDLLFLRYVAVKVNMFEEQIKIFCANKIFNKILNKYLKHQIAPCSHDSEVP